MYFPTYLLVAVYKTATIQLYKWSYFFHPEELHLEVILELTAYYRGKLMGN